MKRIPDDILRKRVFSILQKAGVNDRHAEIVTDCLIETDAYGVHTHGLNVLSAHIERIERGGYALDEEPEITKETAAFAVVDGKKTIGPVSAVFCMNKAVEHAKKDGIYTVLCNNSNTFGAAFYYSLMAAQNNMIGICMCNTPPAMAAWNGRDKILGTNPFSIGIPGKKNGPILLDMATSIVARSKIIEAKDKNEKIPYGWALDETGHPTTDPIEAIRGTVLPMAEYKGYGIAMVIDIISGLLSGAAYLNDVNKFYSKDDSSMNVGAFFSVLNPAVIFSDEFFGKIDDYIERIHDSGGDIMPAVPGENRIKRKLESVRYGIEIEDETEEAIKKLMEKYGIEIK